MRFSEDKLDKLFCSDKVERDIHIWEPPQPRAILLAIHGGLAHGGDYVTPALHFKQKGIATVSYDMVGHDRQPCVHVPRFEQFLDDGELFLQWVKTRYPDAPIFIMGHSMGGLIATHLGSTRFQEDSAIKGYILSSPYYVNKIHVPALLKAASGLLSRLIPKLKIPTQDFTDFLTHDVAITRRHREDEKDFTRAGALTCRFASELMGAQTRLQAMLSRWDHPLLAVVAGDDKLADPEGTQRLLQSVDAQHLEYHFYADNYHENFNELNREVIFEKILIWMDRQLLAAERPTNKRPFATKEKSPTP